MLVNVYANIGGHLAKIGDHEGDIERLDHACDIE